MNDQTQVYQLAADSTFGDVILSVEMTAPAGTLTAGKMFPIELRLKSKGRRRLDSASLIIANREYSPSDAESDKEEYFPISTRAYAIPAPVRGAAEHLARLTVQVPHDAMTSLKTQWNSEKIETAFTVEVKCIDCEPTRFSVAIPVRAAMDATSPRLKGRPVKTSNPQFELQLDDHVCWPGGTLDGKLIIKPSTKADRAQVLSLDLTADIRYGGHHHDKVRLGRTVPGPFKGGLTYPFALKIAPDAPPSFAGQFISVDWLLRASLKVPFAIDPTIGLRFTVVPAPRT